MTPATMNSSSTAPGGPGQRPEPRGAPAAARRAGSSAGRRRRGRRRRRLASAGRRSSDVRVAMRGGSSAAILAALVARSSRRYAPEYAACPTRPRRSCSSATSSADSAAGRCSALLPGAARALRADVRRRQRRERRGRPRDHAEDRRRAVRRRRRRDHARQPHLPPPRDLPVPRRARARSCARPTSCARQPGHGCVRGRARRRAARGRQPVGQPVRARRTRPRSPRPTRCSTASTGKVDHVLVDMHAEATSEKVAMGWYLDGRVTAVVGTHTHVPTADARVLPGGTAYITDVGMTGPRGGVIGVKQGAGDRVAAHADAGPLRDLRATTRGSTGCSCAASRAAARRRDRAGAAAAARLSAAPAARRRAARPSRAGRTTRCRGRTSA